VFYKFLKENYMAKSKDNELRISYDKFADVLYMSFGKPRVGVDEEIEDGVYLRVDERTNKPLGFTIIDFEKRFSTSIEKAIPINLSEVLS